MMNERPLYDVPEGVQTRWASAENPKALMGGACRPGANLDERTAHLTNGRKCSSGGSDGVVYGYWTNLYLF